MIAFYIPKVIAFAGCEYQIKPILDSLVPQPVPTYYSATYGVHILTFFYALDFMTKIHVPSI